MMVYYETFSKKVLLMAVFLFLILLCIDIVKDTLTKVLIKRLDTQPFPIILKAGIPKQLFLCSSLPWQYP
jgi:4-hydroxybenzoate polyprenyltransferase